MPYTRINFTEFRTDPRFARLYSHVRSRPSWVWQIASFAAAMVIIVPIVLLVLTAVLTFVALFVVLSLAHAAADAVATFIGGRTVDTYPADPTRRNVRVIETER